MFLWFWIFPGGGGGGRGYSIIFNIVPALLDLCLQLLLDISSDSLET